MEIGHQIKTLRLRHGVSQETMAQHFGITAQAVSKWERGATTPDISLLPALSAYFGVTIDELFAISDDTRMDRIQNMLWDVRFLDSADVSASREFLLRKAELEPENGRPHELLADLENHLAREHRQRAADYAKEALRRDSTLRNAHSELVQAMGGRSGDWNACSHYQLVDDLRDYISDHPDCRTPYLTIMDQLVDDYRLEEAAQYCRELAKFDHSYRVPLYQGIIAWQAGNREEAFGIWEKMEKEFPDEWCVYHNVGDYLTRAGRYEQAQVYYRKAIDVQPAPRYVDPFEALAQLYERMGDYGSAIAVLKEELEVFRREWDFSTGESADVVRREIDRLERKALHTER